MGEVRTLFGVAREVRVQTPTRVGELTDIDMIGLPDDLTFLLVTIGPIRLHLETPYVGELFFAPGYALVPVGSLDGQGVASLELPAPPIAAGLDAQVMSIQPLFFDANNGLPSVGAPSRAVFLDPSI